MIKRDDFVYSFFSEEDRELIEIREHIWDMAIAIHKMSLDDLLEVDFDLLAQMERYLMSRGMKDGTF